MYSLLTTISIRNRYCESIPQDAEWILKSVVCHLGNDAKSGHYKAYTRFSKHDASPSLWLHLDDLINPSITQVLKKSCFHCWLYRFAVSLDVSVGDVYVCVGVYMLERVAEHACFIFFDVKDEWMDKYRRQTSGTMIRSKKRQCYFSMR
jgi:hypothetical protein